MSQTSEQPLIDGETEKKEKKSTNFIFPLIIFIILAVVIALVLIFTLRKSKDNTFCYDIETIKIPDNYKLDHGHYLYNDKIVISYKVGDSNELHIATMDDDGKNIKDIWAGNYTNIYKSNGFRMLPFADNKRILLGDFILECDKTFGECENATLVKVIYPEVITNNSKLIDVWSEPIVAQDCNHIAWTTLDIDHGSVNFVARIKRTDNQYELENIQIISNLQLFKYDEQTRIIHPEIIRNGEIKQFVNGGSAVTEAGAWDHGVAKSLYQDLASEDVYPIDLQPSYEETTILSPDNKLGMVMSTRFSPNTNLAILGLAPSPHGIIVTASIIQNAYNFAITQVRRSGSGNIGPILVDIDKAKKDSTYKGYNLHKDDDWNFNSPMSWHSSSKKALFLEVSRNNATSRQRRLRRVDLKNYQAGSSIPTKDTPDNISYALPLSNYSSPVVSSLEGKITGTNGEIQIKKNQTYAEAVYCNYSNDGKTFYNGEILFINDRVNHITTYTSTVNGTGEDPSTMNFRLKFDQNSKLLFDMDTDGHPKTYGFAEYKGEKIDASIYNSSNTDSNILLF